MAAVAALAGTVGYVVVDSGVLPEWVAVGLVLTLLALVPSAPTLAGRLLLNIGLTVGWAPLLWWVDWGVDLNHGGALVAVAVGVSVGTVTVRRSWRALLPGTRWVDLLLPGAVVAAGVATLPLSRVTDPVRALAVLVPGADNWAHFDMFTTIRARGALTDALGGAPAPDGSGWAYDTYPKGFHALVASLSEVTAPTLRPDPDGLVVYAHAVALLVVLGTVLVTAAVLSVPRLAQRPALTVPAVAVTWTALLWEPGQKVLANGFASFWLAAVAAATALLLSLASPQSSSWLRVVTVGGLLVSVAHTWTPLVVVAAPAALAVLVAPHDRATGRPGRRVVALRLAVLTVAALAAAKALVILFATVEVGFIVSEVSGFDGTSPLPTFALLLAVLLAVLAVLSGRCPVRDDEGESLVGRFRSLLLAVVLGVGSLATLLVLQVRTIGTTSYYFLKYLLGFELILACVAPAVVALVMAGLLPHRRAPWRLGVSAAAVVTATFAFGLPLWAGGLLFSTTDDGTAAVQAPYSRAALSRGVVAAARTTTPAESLDTTYVAVGAGNAVEIFYPDAWYHAINATATGTVSARSTVLRTNADTVGEAAALARRLLRADPAVQIVVDPAVLEEMRAAVDDAALAARVRPIGS